MAKVSVSFGENPVIVLNLKPKFIKAHDLQLILATSSIYDTFLPNLSSNDEFIYPCLLPPKLKIKTFNFLKEFINLFESILEQYKDLKSHSDELLFLATTYNITQGKKRNHVANQEYLRKNGKLLVKFINAPLPKYTKFNIYEAFDENDLYHSNINDLLLTYLHVVSKSPISNFTNSAGQLDFTKINDELEHKLIRRIVADKNISIEMSNGNYLIVSKNIQAHFLPSPPSTKSKIKVQDETQTFLINNLIVQFLFEEQKKAETDLYYSLLEFDFYSGKGKNNLTKTVNNYNRSGYHTFNLRELHTLLTSYFRLNKLIINDTELSSNQLRNDFIYQYFILFGFFLTSGRELQDYTSVTEIKDKINLFDKKKTISRNYSTKFFTDTFKNLDRNNNFFNDFLRSNSSPI